MKMIIVIKIKCVKLDISEAQRAENEFNHTALLFDKFTFKQ